MYALLHHMTVHVQSPTTYMVGAALTHPIHLAIAGTHTLNLNSDFTKQSRGNPKAVRWERLACE